MAAPFATNDLRRNLVDSLRPDEYPDLGENMRKCAANKRTRIKAIPRARLEAMIEEATVDCYNESEQASGFFCMLEDRLAVPFTTKLLGKEVIVEKIDITEEDEILAICRHRQNRQRISILDLPIPSPRPPGAEWIDAYRHWARWR